MVCWALSSKEEAAFEGTTLRDAGRCETGPRWFSFERPFSAIESCDVNGSMGSIALDARRVAIGQGAVRQCRLPAPPELLRRDNVCRAGARGARRTRRFWATGARGKVGRGQRRGKATLERSARGTRDVPHSS
jgi:hypothetical protein